MKAQAHCLGCLEGLGERFALAASGGAGSPLHLRALDAALSVLARRFRPGRSVPTRTATRMLRAVRAETGNPDPFRDLKEIEFRKGLEAAGRLAGFFGDGLPDLVRLSAAGNHIDFFRDMDEIERSWREEGSGGGRVAVDDTAALVEAMLEGGPVMVLADNTGEVPFDLPLLRRLESLGIETVYGVKGLPSQNDITLADMARFGVVCPSLTGNGTDWVGSELAVAGKSFREHWVRAGVVVSKGMANLETLTEYPPELAAKRVFFVLVAKCPPVAEYLGVEQGSAVVLDARRLSGKSV